MSATQFPMPTAEIDESVVDPRAVADLMAALEQVCRIGVFYPPGHALCDQAAERFLSAVSLVAGKSPSVRFETKSDSLFVQRIELDEDLTGVASFYELLDQLGIARIDIDCEISAAELHEFVTKLIAFRKQLRGAHGFRHIEIDGLPAAVRIHQREFLASPGAESTDDGSEDPSQPRLDTLLAALESRGLDGSQIARCRRLMEAIPADLETRRSAEGNLPQVSWADVEKLLARFAQQNPGVDGDIETPGGPEQPSSLDELTSVFEALDKDDANANAREAIDLVLSLSKRPNSESVSSSTQNVDDKKHSRRPTSNESDEMSLDELRAELSVCAAQADGPANLKSEDRGEELSILMLMLRSDQRLPVQARIEKKLREIVASSLSPVEWQILIEGVRQLLTPQERDRLADTSVMIMEALRCSPHRSPLAFLRDVAQGCEQSRITTLWPLIVNELLLNDRRTDTAVFGELCELVGSLNTEVMQATLPQLEQLEALRERKVTTDIFAPPPRALYPVFSQLLESSHGPFLGKQLVIGLRRSPQGWLGDAILPLISRFTPRHRQFLAGLLWQEDNDRPSTTMKDLAGRILAESLPALTSEQRKQEWVPNTIRMVARLPVPNGEPILHRIAYDKRFSFISEWPFACRAAARETLAELRDRSD